MAKVFDIVRRPRRERPTPASTRKRSSSSSTLFLFLLLVFFLVGASLLTGSPKQVSQESKPVKQEAPAQIASPPPIPQPSTAHTIQLLDGSDDPNKFQKIQQQLASANLNVTSTEPARFTYEKSTVYYRPGLESQAKQVAEVLRDLQPTLKESKVTGFYDILVIIGRK